jgi:hypothetical protein
MSLQPAEIPSDSGPSWSDHDLTFFALVVRIMELDPNLERLERIFLNAADLVHRIRSTPENP